MFFFVLIVRWTGEGGIYKWRRAVCNDIRTEEPRNNCWTFMTFFVRILIKTFFVRILIYKLNEFLDWRKIKTYQSRIHFVCSEMYGGPESPYVTYSFYLSSVLAENVRNLLPKRTLVILNCKEWVEKKIDRIKLLYYSSIVPWCLNA